MLRPGIVGMRRSTYGHTTTAVQAVSTPRPRLPTLQPVRLLWFFPPPRPPRARQSLRSLCLWEGWEFLEAQMASAIIDEVASESEPGPQSPYETRLTGECPGWAPASTNIAGCLWLFFHGSFRGLSCCTSECVFRMTPP